MINTSEMTIYTAECDKCKKDYEHGDINLFPDRQAMVEYMENDGWVLTENGCTCEECSNPTLV